MTLDINTLPADVRAFWQTELASPPPPMGHGRHFLALLREARKRWPERDCGNDATLVMYSGAQALGAP